MKGDCEQASPSPADKRAPKILTRPCAARSPGPQRQQEQAVPPLLAKGSPGGRRHSGEQRRMLINYLPCSALANLPPASLATPGSRCCSDPRRGNCCPPTGSAFKEHVAGCHAGEGGPALPFRRPWERPCPPDTPQGELGGKLWQLTEVFPHQLHGGERRGGWCLVLLFFFVSVCGSWGQGWGHPRVPGLGERGVLREQLSPECHPPSRCSPRTRDIRAAPGAALSSCPVPGAGDTAAPFSPQTLPHRPCQLLQRLSTPQSPPVPNLRAHLRAARPHHTAARPAPSPGAEPAAPCPEPWLCISCLAGMNAHGVP